MDVFERIFEFTPDALLVIDRDGLISQVNGQAEKMFGYKRTELIGRTVESLIPQRFVTRHIDHRTGYLAGPRTRPMGAGLPLYARRKDESEFPVDIMLGPMASAEDCDVLCVVRDISERKRSDEAAREIEERFRGAFDFAAIGMALVGLDGRWLRVNRSLCTIVGYSEEELLARDFQSITHPDDLDSDLEFVRQMRDGKISSYQMEKRYFHKQGQIVWVLLSVSMVRNADGEPLYFISQIQDITERKRSEEVRARLAAIVESAVDAIIGKNLNGIIESWNPGAERLFGYTAAEAIGKPATILLEAGNVDEETRIAEEIRRGKPIAPYESIRRHKDGSPIEVWLTMSPVMDNQGEVIGSSEIARDITERRLSEQSVQRARDAEESARQYLQALIDSATQVSIIATDSNGLISIFNSGAEQMLGYAASEMVGKMSPESIHLKSEVIARGEELSRELGRPIAGFDVFVERARQDNHYDEREWTYVCRDGRHITVSLVVTAIRDKDGEISGYLGIAVDITQRKRAELELKVARDRALTATQAKSAFLANMSHEIRTPLNGVIGIAGLLLDTSLDSEQLKYAQTIRASGQHLLDLINDILDFSKIEAGKLELEFIDFNLQNAVEDVTSTLAYKATEKGLALAWQLDSDVPRLLCGDPARLRQVLLNLIVNAIKFTREGEVSVKIALDREDKSSVTLRFTVRDTGIGIPKDRIEDLFHAFTQADTSTTRKYGGTGLGLAICKEITELMGGTIGVESEPGRGTTFWFTAVIAKQATESMPAPAKITGERILVVDTSTVNRHRVCSALDRWGCHVDEASTFDDALNSLETAAESGHPFRIAVLRDSASHISVTAFARLVRAKPELANTHLVMLSTFGLRGDAAELSLSGFSAYLTHPVNDSELHDCIANVLAIPNAHAVAAGGAHLITRHTIEDSRRRYRILLVEDNAVNQMVAMGVIGKLGHHVKAAENGQMAIEFLESDSFDLVLMDCQMPVMDGYEATRIIRDPASRVQNHNIAIVAMTANALAEDREFCLKTGMNDYVTKPVRADVLRTVLDRWLSVSNPELSHKNR
jgi:two-component system sensor histidine kinase/response regulator